MYLDSHAATYMKIENPTNNKVKKGRRGRECVLGGYDA